jgi:hypothetical protein
MNKWIVFGASGGAESSAPIPGQPTITIRGYRYLPADADGRIYVEVLATITPPDPAVTYEGAHIWLQNPDSYGAEDFGGGIEFSLDEIGAPWAPVLMTWVAVDTECRFKFPAPDTARYVRLYAVASSQSIELMPIEKGQTGESPNVAFQVDAPPSQGAGQEYCPNVRIGSVTVEYDTTTVSDSGRQMWRLVIPWQWPTEDPAIATLAGIDVVVNDFDSSTSDDVQASVAIEREQTEGSFTTEWKEVPSSPAMRRVELIAYDTSGRRNTYQYGVTPSFVVTVQRQAGGAGLEFSPNVTPAATFVEIIALDGGVTNRRLVRTHWSPPNDSRFGGVYVWYERPDGVRRCVGGSRLGPTEHEFMNPTSIQNWTWYVVSCDAASGRQNTIVPGVTPSQVVSVGSTAGTVDLGQSFNYNSSRLRQNGGALDIQVGGIGTEYLAAAGIDIGPTTGAQPNKTPWLRIQDGLGALLAIFGDFTALIAGGFVGAWMKRCWIGGSSPATAKIKCDTNGDVTIEDATLTLHKNGVRTRIDNHPGLVTGSYNGIQVAEYPSGAYPASLAPGWLLMGAQDGVTRVELQVGEPIVGPGFTTLRFKNAAGVIKSYIGNGGIGVDGFDLLVKGASLIIEDAGGTPRLEIPSTGIIDFTATRSSATTGGASALPALPAGYVDVTVNGSNFCMPYYAR